MPVVGGIIGALVGGFGGANLGEKYIVKAYRKLDNEIQTTKTKGFGHRFRDLKMTPEEEEYLTALIFFKAK